MKTETAEEERRVERQAPDQRCTSGSRPVEAEQRLRPEEPDPHGPWLSTAARSRPAAEARQEQRVGPEQERRRPARRARPSAWPRASRGRRSAPAGTARRRRRRSARSPPARRSRRSGAEIEEAEQQDQRDADPPRVSRQPPHVADRPLARRVSRSAIGMTIWFDTIVDSAIAATITIEVADEKPPRKASSASSSCPAASGSVRTNRSGLEPAGSVVSPTSAIGSDEEAHPSR